MRHSKAKQQRDKPTYKYYFTSTENVLVPWPDTISLYATDLGSAGNTGGPLAGGRRGSQRSPSMKAVS